MLVEAQKPKPPLIPQVERRLLSSSSFRRRSPVTTPCRPLRWKATATMWTLHASCPQAALTPHLNWSLNPQPRLDFMSFQGGRPLTRPACPTICQCKALITGKRPALTQGMVWGLILYRPPLDALTVEHSSAHVAPQAQVHHVCHSPTLFDGCKRVAGSRYSIILPDEGMEAFFFVMKKDHKALQQRRSVRAAPAPSKYPSPHLSPRQGGVGCVGVGIGRRLCSPTSSAYCLIPRQGR